MTCLYTTFSVSDVIQLGESKTKKINYPLTCAFSTCEILLTETICSLGWSRGCLGLFGHAIIAKPTLPLNLCVDQELMQNV